MWTAVPSLFIVWQYEQLDDLKDEVGLTMRKVEHLSTISQHNVLSKLSRHFLAKMQVLTLSIMSLSILSVIERQTY